MRLHLLGRKCIRMDKQQFHWIYNKRARYEYLLYQSHHLLFAIAACFIIGTVCLPIGIVFQLEFAFQAFKQSQRYVVHSILYLSLSIVFFGLSSLAYNMNSALNIVDCGVLFCFQAALATLPTTNPLNPAAIIHVGESFLLQRTSLSCKSIRHYWASSS